MYGMVCMYVHMYIGIYNINGFPGLRALRKAKVVTFGTVADNTLHKQGSQRERGTVILDLMGLSSWSEQFPTQLELRACRKASPKKEMQLLIQGNERRRCGKGAKSINGKSS